MYFILYTDLVDKTKLFSEFQSLMIPGQLANWGLKLYFGFRTKKNLKKQFILLS